MLKQNKKQEGFTIIEVMLVLAIAGLIMLIVFLAVPALQRNSRNTQRKNDVSAVLGAVNEWMSNNAGKVVASGDLAALKPNVNPGYYDNSAASGPGSITIDGTGGATTALGTTAADDRMVIVPKAKCGASGITVAGPSRAVAMKYLVETSGSFQPMCQDG